MRAFNFGTLLLCLSKLPTLHGTDVHDVIPRAVSACSTIAGEISGASAVYYTASANYVTDQEHFFSSSSQASACVVEVGSNDDTAKVIKTIASTRSPFAIKSGGHSSNQGFSSTPGVLISLTRFKNFTLAADHSSIVLGTGNTWVKDVYPQLDNTGYGVVGGRVTGPGVGGFSLGGGYSWLTNQYGLTVDNVLEYTLILPNGTISQVTSAQTDLFFALKGGLNRFGIVTTVTLKLVPQPAQVWGGYATYANTSFSALISATAKFSATNTDAKAQIITTLAYLASAPLAVLLIFYDGPTPSASLKPFLSIPSLSSDIKTRSFSNFASSAPSETDSGQRGLFHTLSTTGYTQTFINAVYNESVFYGALASLHTGTFISYDVEPFLKTYGTHSPGGNTGSAYPHARSPLPLDLQFNWLSPTEDTWWQSAAQTSIDHLRSVAQAEGILDSQAVGRISYPNYSPATLSAAQLYGTVNAARLSKIRQQVDPNGVMELSGGFNV